MLDGDSLMPITNLSPDSQEAAVLADHLPVGIPIPFATRSKHTGTRSRHGYGRIMGSCIAGSAEMTAVEENQPHHRYLERRLWRYSLTTCFEESGVKVINQASRVYARQPG